MNWSRVKHPVGFAMGAAVRAKNHDKKRKIYTVPSGVELKNICNILNYLSFGGNTEYNDNRRYMFLTEGNEAIGNLY